MGLGIHTTVSSKITSEKITIRLAILVISISVIAASETSRIFITRLWYAIGNVFQLCWEKCLSYSGEDPITLWVYGPMAIMLVFYWGGGLVFILMDLTNKPKFLRKYKIRPGTNEPLEINRVFTAVMWLLINQTVVAYLFGRFVLWFMERRGYPDVRQLPALHSIIIDFFISALLSEIVFYYSHRLLHLKLLYKHIHKQHHEWQSPIAIAAFYCNPIEHVIGNLSSLHVGHMILGSHVFTVYLYYMLGIIDALINHCGYHLPFIKSPEFHDYHHARFTECFGLLGLLDRIHGTDQKFKRSAEYRRHSVMLHLVPPRELIPE